MKQYKIKQKRIYQKPKVRKINLDNVTSLYMMSEGTIPDSPPWAIEIKKNNNPFKTNIV